MSNERPDEFLSWRGRLGQPDALPEQGLDNPEATWERLNARLGEVRLGEIRPGESTHSGGIVPDLKTTGGKRRRRVYWYGVAAAFLLLALIPAIRSFRGRPVAKSTMPAVIRLQAGTDREASRGFAGLTTAPMTAPRMPEARLTTIPIAASKEKWPAGDRRGRKTGPVTLSAIADRQERVEGVALADSGVRLAVCTPPVKKALRVVSINEIDNPTATGPAITVHWPSVPFRIQLVPRGSDFIPVTANRETAPVLLKIKLNPQNP